MHEKRVRLRYHLEKRSLFIQSLCGRKGMRSKIVFLIVPIVFLLSGFACASSEMEDVVYVNDGTSVRGKILELNTIRVIVEKKDGTKIEIPFKDIYTIKEEEIRSSEEVKNDATEWENALEGKWGIGVRFGFQKISDDDLLGIVDVEFDQSVPYGINFTYFLQAFSVELSIEQSKEDVDLSFMGLSGNIGELTQTAALLSGRLHIPAGQRLYPFIGGGIGYYLNRFNAVSNPLGVTIDADNSFGFHANAGVEIFITKEMAFNLDLKYVWNKADFTTTVSGLGSGMTSI